MKKLAFLPLLVLFYYNCNSQNLEIHLQFRKTLVKQRDDLLKRAKELQIKIDSIDYQANKRPTKKSASYFTKTVKYNNGHNYTSKNTRAYKQYRGKTTRTYYRGPRGGCYYINSNGNKTYVVRSMCN